MFSNLWVFLISRSQYYSNSVCYDDNITKGQLSMTPSIHKTLQQSLAVFYLLCFIAIYFIISATVYLNGFESLLINVSRENGLFETATVIVLFSISFYSAISARQCLFTHNTIPYYRQLLMLLSVVTFLAAMEEISWGQQWFGFSSGEFFQKNNLQKETNLHNLIDGVIVSSVLIGIVYWCFIYPTLLLSAFPNNVHVNRLLRFYKPLIASPDALVMFCYTACLQAFYVPSVWPDTLGVIVALFGLLLVFILNPGFRRWHLILHWLLVVLFLLLCMQHPDIFNFYNRQYEIREFLICLVFFYYLSQLNIRQGLTTAKG